MLKMIVAKFLKIFGRYGLFGTIRLIRDVMASRMLYGNVRLMRYPFYLRGSKYINLGRGFTSGVGLRLDAFGEHKSTQIEIGDNVEVGDYVHIGAVNSVKIGKNCLFASRVYISDHDHGVYFGDIQSHPTEFQNHKKIHAEKVVISENVWIGEGVTVLKGVTIGENSIIGASSVVTESLPPNVIAVGIPARVIKVWNSELSSWVRHEH